MWVAQRIAWSSPSVPLKRGCFGYWLSWLTEGCNLKAEITWSRRQAIKLSLGRSGLWKCWGVRDSTGPSEGSWARVSVTVASAPAPHTARAPVSSCGPALGVRAFQLFLRAWLSLTGPSAGWRWQLPRLLAGLQRVKRVLRGSEGHGMLPSI